MKKVLTASVALLVSAITFSQKKATISTSNLYKEFQSPGNAARPRVWWHWMNGNITKDGIRKDLLWMNRSGIGGFQNFDAALMTPQIVEKRLIYMTPGWKDAFRFTTKLADSLKLEMAIAGSPGWSVTGGPWVQPKDGMKKLVWQEVRVKGGQPFNSVLPKPSNTTGPFQNVLVVVEAFSAATSAPLPVYYEDIAVVAYRLLATDISLNELAPKVSSSSGNFTLTQLTDNDLATTSVLPKDTAGGHAWIQYEFPQSQTIKAITIVGGGTRSQWGVVFPDEGHSLQASDDGVNFRKVASLPLGGAVQQTIAVPATTARYFRVLFPAPPASEFAAIAAQLGYPMKPPAGTDIAEIRLHSNTLINHAEEKAGFAAAFNLEQFPTPATADAVPEEDVIDLTAKMGADGMLNWTPPAGEWKIVRFGYSLTGKQNHPAPEEATGLEVDKMDARASRDYFTNYLNQYKDATGGLMGAKGLQYMVTDSYEAGQETWTPGMAEEFQKRRGYSLLTWMPVLTGAIVKSAEASEKFLWDWRKTMSELIVENHYDLLTGILKEYGMKRYSEAHENGRVYIVDGMDVKRTAAVPMSAMWASPGVGSTLTMAEADIRESASVAHIYGQNLVAAESLTALGFGGNGAWGYHPGNLKPVADLELASGLNRFVIHTSIHQPVDDKIPGLGLGPFGQWFNRHDTWAPYAKTWTDYLARRSYILQQGKFVADVVLYYGEDNNITGLYGAKLPEVPEGYSYDFINPHALINLLSVKDGRLVTPSGMSYRVLHLDSNARKMSLPVLRKIAHLVKNGASISGVKPQSSPSLKDDQQEFQRLLADIWGSQKSRAPATRKVYTGLSIQEVFTSMNVQPDFQYTKPADSTKLLFVHRKLSNGDIYWINNRTGDAQNLKATFRISGKAPQIWHPETGNTEQASYSITGNMTTVDLSLTPDDAVFVVFQAPASKASVSFPSKKESNVLSIEGPWQVSFQSGRGAPAMATFENLTSYTENSSEGIKYFSGTATYTKTINVPANQLGKGLQLWLDLGDVKNLAEVNVNGKSLGVVWKTPFRIDATSALKAGKNNIVIRVANLWVNRLIGDLQPNVKEKITYTTMPFYQAKAKLLPSGLLGPVKIISVSR